MPHAVKRQFCQSHCLKHHLSVIGGITRGAEGSSCKYETIRSREQMFSASWPLLLREIAGQILVIWDGASIHRCQAVKDFTSKPGAGRIHLERLPAYAPELNPQEGVWNLLKRVELKNVCCHDLQQVRQQLTLAKERLRHRKSTLAQCYAHAGYSL
jgi:transposase